MKFDLSPFFESSIEPCCVVGEDGYFKLVNKAFAVVTGYSSEELTSQPLLNFLAKEDIAGTIDKLKISDQQGGVLRFENRYRCKDGSIKWLAWSSVSINGLIYATARDVTSLKTTERELREKNTSLQMVMENAPVLLVCVDINGTITLSTGRQSRHSLSGNDRGIGKNIFVIYKGESTVLEPIRKALSGEVVNFNLEWKGEVYQNTYSPMYDECGNIIGAVLVCVDITEMTEARNKLETYRQQIAAQQAERQFHGISEAIPQMVWISDSEGNVNYFNQRWYDYTGLNPEQTYGSGWTQALHPEDKEECINVRKKSFQSGEGFEMEYRFFNARNGTYRWHLERAIPVRDSESRIVQWFGTCTDIDDQRRTLIQLQRSIDDLKQMSEEKSELLMREKAAVEASKMKSEFLANMSHEIRTPLNGILGMNRLLLNSRINKKQKELLEMAQESGQNLLALINDLLDFSKIEAGHMEIELISFDLRQLAKEIRQVAEIMAQEKKIRFQLDLFSSESYFYVSDPERLRQVLYNLIHNAIKFTSLGGVKLVIREEEVGEQDSVLLFQVIDSGVGVSVEMRDFIFEPFNQGDSSITRKYGGTGLGLSICKKILQRMGGEIGFESNDEGGSNFWFRIKLRKPIAKENEYDNRRTATVKSINVPLGKISGNVLVAEDNAVNQTLVKHLLEKRGLQVDLANNGNEAIQLVHQKKYHLIIMDCHMPEMDGFTAAKAIRSNKSPQISKIPILALTADVSQGIEKKCTVHGMNGYIKKPIQFDIFNASVDKFLKSSSKKKKNILDLSVLEKLEALNSSDLSDIRSELIGLFLEKTPKKIAELEKALLAGDYQEMKSIAHSLKSSSAQLGAVEFSDICRKIEARPRTKACVELVKTSFERLQIELSEFNPTKKRIV